MTKPFEFNSRETAARYEDEGPRRFVPGYDVSHAMAATLLRDRLRDSGRILVLGAGGGVELSVFAKASPGWTFVGVDPSEQMLAQAADKLRAAHLDDRVQLVKGYVPDAPEDPFDAATCFLTFGFIADDGTRLDVLRHIRRRLTAGASFLLIDFCADKNSPAFEAQLRLYGAFARMNGAPADLVAQAARGMRDVMHIVTPAREEALLQEAGFDDVTLFYRAFQVHGWIARAS
ncbi:class I SAM-dependent methyltransferase [Chondromyces apiculatus]|nr:class I SAM-dependent methyltransferase [Chondromyces apiculatus]